MSYGKNAYLYVNGRIAVYQTAIQNLGADALRSAWQVYNASGLVIADVPHDPFGSALAQNGTASK